MTIGVGSLVTKLAYRPCKLIFRPSLCLWMLSSVLLGEFAKLRKATISFVMPGARPFVHLSNSMEHLGSQCSGAHDIWYSRIFFPPPEKPVECLYEDVCLGASFSAWPICADPALSWIVIIFSKGYYHCDLLSSCRRRLSNRRRTAATLTQRRAKRWASANRSNRKKKKQPIHLKHVDEFLLE